VKNDKNSQKHIFDLAKKDTDLYINKKISEKISSNINKEINFIKKV